MRPLVAVLVMTLPVSAAVPPEAVAAKAVLVKHCYRCHGEKGTAEGGMNFILDHAKLLAKGSVIPKNAAKSLLYSRTQSGDMPADDKTKPTADEIAVLKTWIEQGAPNFDETTGEVKVATREEIVAAMLKDVDRNPVFEHRKFTRYFTLSHFKSAGRPEEEIQTYRNGLSKLVNSLSFGRTIVKLVPVNADATIFRIDLRDLNWSSATWNEIARVHPFGLEPTTADEKRLALLTGTRIPFVRGDWFVATASRPPLYHTILGIPETVSILETRLGVDVARNIANSRVLRAGFNGSGVSKNNRMIERHDSIFGSYWKSYDFASNAGKQNLFDRPLGPGKDVRRFAHDGGEIIFNLPNGLQAYMLVDADGKRIDKGPTAIVSDPARPDRAVENGISCMGCHAQGMIRKDDQIRKHVLGNAAAFDKDEAARIKQVYVGSAAVNKAIDEDTARFKKAVEECGVPLTKNEPVITTAKKFEDELDLAMLLGELEIPLERFKAVLKTNDDLARALGGVLVKGGTVQRDAFTLSWPRVQHSHGHDIGRRGYTLGTLLEPTPKLPFGIRDNMLAFSSDAVRAAQDTIFKTKTELGHDIVVLTLANLPPEFFAEYQSADDEGRRKVMLKFSDFVDGVFPFKGICLVLVQEDTQDRWVVSSRGLGTGVNARVLAEVTPLFKERKYDEGLKAFLDKSRDIIIEAKINK